MLDRSAKSQKVSGPQFVDLPLRAVANMSLQHMHGARAIDMMLLHLGSCFHGDKNNSKILLLIKRSGMDARGPGPSLFGLGYLAQGNVPGSQEAYEAACREHGHQPGMTLLPERDTPSVVFVAPDVDLAWREIGPHLLHDARMYADWNPGDQTTVGIADVNDVDELRATSRTHRIFTADEAIAYVRGGGMLTLAPLCGGISPDVAWKYLRYVDEAVMPALRNNS